MNQLFWWSLNDQIFSGSSFRYFRGFGKPSPIYLMVLLFPSKYQMASVAALNKQKWLKDKTNWWFKGICMHIFSKSIRKLIFYCVFVFYWLLHLLFFVLFFSFPQRPEHEQHHWASSICIQELPLSGRTVSTCRFSPNDVFMLYSVDMRAGPYDMHLVIWVCTAAHSMGPSPCPSQLLMISTVLLSVRNHSPFIKWSRAIIKGTVKLN